MYINVKRLGESLVEVTTSTYIIEDIITTIDSLSDGVHSKEILELRRMLNCSLGNVSDSTKNILKEIRQSTEGWHTSIECDREEMRTFENEFPNRYILDVEEVESINDNGLTTYYVTLGTKWYETFGYIIL